MSLVKRIFRDGIIVLICLILREWSIVRRPIRQTDADEVRIGENFTIIEDNTSYVINCNLTAEEATSAIARAKTNRCKQLIADFACKLERGEAFPKFLLNSCPGDQHKIGEYLGCYNENRTVLPYVGVYDDNSVQNCIDICRTSGKVHAALKEKECFCVDEISKLIKGDEKLCDSVCPGNTTAKCGGNSTVSIYLTGLDEKKEAHWISPAEGEDWGKIRIAFFLAINGRQVRQVKQLLRSIYTPDHLYLIHVEERAQFLNDELLYLEEKYPNIVLQRRRVRGNWGSPSLLHGIWSGIQELLQMGSWDYWINLSESCYPLEYVGDLEDFLAANRGINFMSSPTENPFESLKSQGLSKAFVECDDYLFLVGSKTLPKGIRIDFGSDWFIFHRSFAEFVVSDDPLIRGLQQVFNYSFLSPESFFHFAMQNSKFCNKVTSTNLHAINWKHKKIDGQCHCNKYVDACGCSPVAFRKEDFYNLSYFGKLPDAYFARKFDATISQSVITSLGQYVVEPPLPEGTPALYSYWEPLFFKKRDKESEFSHHAFEISKILLQEVRLFTQLTPFTLEAVTSFYDKDSYQGFLVKIMAEEYGVLELFIKPQRTFKKVADSSLEGSRLHNLKVGEDYIQKERVFRNRACYIHTGSKITLEHRWLTSETQINATFVWIDPYNNIANVSTVTVSNMTEVQCFRLEESVAILPGEWTVIVLEDDAIAGYLDFPVFSTYSPKSRRKQSEKVDTPRPLTSYVSRRTRTGSKEFNDLTRYLTTMYYFLESICVDEENPGSLGDITTVCQKTSWSSLSPDPKSEF